MASGNDMKAHKQTYDGFMVLLKWAIPVIAIIAAFVVVMISS